MSPRRLSALALAVFVLLAAFTPAATGAPQRRQARPGSVCRDRDDAAKRWTLSVAGENATGFIALPDRAPVGIVIFSHGYGHSSYSWQHHLRRVAAELGVIAVAMDYRGLVFTGTMKSSGVPNTTGWPVQAGAEDGIAAAQWFERRCRTAKTIVNYGVSMGGNTSGIMAATAAKRADGATPLFDYWIDIEGATSLIETYLEARLIGNAAQQDIERETGGPLESRQEAFLRRNVVTRAADIKAAGVKGVVIVQGVDDGLVPYNQSQEMRTALQLVGIPTQFFTVTLKSDESERETTLSGAVANSVQKDYRSPFAGHTSEMSTTHIVSLTGFARLNAIFRGAPPVCTREYVVDGQLGTLPPVTDC